MVYWIILRLACDEEIKKLKLPDEENLSDVVRNRDDVIGIVKGCTNLLYKIMRRA